MGEELVQELCTGNDASGASIHSIDVGGLVELDTVITRMFVLETQLLPGLGHLL